jgi:hypothetical protein
MPERQVAASAADLALTIVKKALGIFISKTLPYHRQFFWMYDNAIAEFVYTQSPVTAKAWANQSRLGNKQFYGRIFARSSHMMLKSKSKRKKRGELHESLFSYHGNLGH